MSLPNAVEAAQPKVPGGKQVQVDLAQDAFTVSYADALVGAPQMLTTIEALGFDPVLLQSGLGLSQISGVKSLLAQIQKLID
ncbi:heavy-metal-associated domain-containing protein [Pseudomonadales bacterium]|nr:heavy-metal-associated domain-containing protein [Pseudomonadales bacterium]MDB9879048.1 heavy-metal-associated domain-containing protein [Pseudomonadales bacterium]MDC1368379.1 heavy-metal-associated domain-containing protein [Pseudomonadales bacterium]